MEFKKPNWDEWSRETAMLWQAVALSLDIDPGDPNVEEVFDLPFEHRRVTTPTGQIERRAPIGVDENDPRVVDLRERSRAAIEDPELPFIDDEQDRYPELQELHLVDFAEFALHRGWALPDRFPRPYRGEAGLVTIILPYTTKELDSLFQIMREFWTTYNPENPPQSSAVAEAIAKTLGYNTRDADTLAALIRPDPVAGPDGRSHSKRRKRRKDVPDGNS